MAALGSGSKGWKQKLDMLSLETSVCFSSCKDNLVLEQILAGICCPLSII